MEKNNGTKVENYLLPICYLMKMTKKEAFSAGFCERACGLWCGRSKKCNGDILVKISSEGYLVDDPSEFCRVSPQTIEIFKQEYGWNPKTKRIKK